MEVGEVFFEHDKHNHKRHTRSTQWDPNVEFNCCDEIVTRKIMLNQSGNQEMYEVMTDHTSLNEIQAQQHENEEIIQLSNEI